MELLLGTFIITFTIVYFGSFLILNHRFQKAQRSFFRNHKQFS